MHALTPFSKILNLQTNLIYFRNTFNIKSYYYPLFEKKKKKKKKRERHLNELNFIFAYSSLIQRYAT